MRFFGQIFILILVQFSFIAPAWAHMDGHEHSFIASISHFVTHLLMAINPIILASSLPVLLLAAVFYLQTKQATVSARDRYQNIKADS